MAWKYDMSKDGGDKLHELVEGSDGSNESMAQILEQLQSCCQEIARRMEGTPGQDDFDDFRSLLEGEPQVFRDDDIKLVRECGYDTFEDLVDSRLSDFYDLCDDYRVWLGIGVSTPHTPQPQLGEMSL